MVFQVSVMVAVAGGEAAGRAPRENRSCTSEPLSGQRCLAAVSRHRRLAITSVLARFFLVPAAHASMIYIRHQAGPGWAVGWKRLEVSNPWSGRSLPLGKGWIQSTSALSG